jgi:hypothetical protein
VPDTRLGRRGLRLRQSPSPSKNPPSRCRRIILKSTPDGHQEETVRGKGSAQAQVAYVTTADVQVAERRRGHCDDVKSFAVPPTSDDRYIFPNGEMDPVLPGTADTLESIAC